MKGIRRLQHESLEERRLLAANCLPLAAEIEDSGLVSLSLPEAEQTLVEDGVQRDIALPAVEYFNLGYGPDLIHEQANQLFVVDQDPYGQTGGSLFLFERTEAGSLEMVKEIEVGFHVDRMIVQGDQILLFGNVLHLVRPLAAEGNVNADGTVALPEHATIKVVTVNLGEEVEVIRQELEGIFHQIHHQGDRIVMTSSAGDDALIAIWPPPEIHGLLRTLQITPDGLRQTAAIEIPIHIFTEVHGDTLISARTVHREIVYLDDPNSGAREDPQGEAIRPPDGIPLPHFVSVAEIIHFHLGDGRIEKVAELELGSGFVNGVHLSEDGQTGLVTVTDFGELGAQTNVVMLDFSGDQMRLFEEVTARGVPIATYDDYVVLSDFESTLSIVDTNQAIDLAAENRIRRLELPARVRLNYSVLRVSGDRIVVSAHRLEEANDDGLLPPLSNDSIGIDGQILPPRIVDNILLTISLSEGRIVADSHLGEGTSFHLLHQFFSIDAESDRFGFFASETSAAEDRGMRFVFGRLSENGEFVRDGSIRVDQWLEIDANADRLIARQADRLIEYHWSNVDDPIITPLGEEQPPIEAVNDEYRLDDNGEDHLLNVLANDLIGHRPERAAEIVELIGAPEGAEIVAGHLVRIPAAALAGKDSLRFEYVISDGRSSSRAVVEIAIHSVNDDQVRELVQRVRRQAAEDFGVSVEEVKITFVERIFNQPLPIVLPGHPDDELDLSPGILVTLTVPNGTALYAASLDGQIIQVFASVRDFLVELGLRAVGDDGETLSELIAGEEFWLEFNAKDLRNFGEGVYAAFFDLVVPTEHILLNGPIEYGEGFIGLPQGELAAGFVDDIGALGNVVESPGNGLQEILRIRATAVAVGEVTLRPEAADLLGSETLLRGHETAVPTHSVRYKPLTLAIVEAPAVDPLDVDGNGVVSAKDALKVINFLHLYGTTTLAELADRVSLVRGEGESPAGDEMAEMRRLDTNRSDSITALDALVIINRLDQELPVMAMAEEIDPAAVFGSDRPIDDDQLRGLF